MGEIAYSAESANAKHNEKRIIIDLTDTIGGKTAYVYGENGKIEI